MNADMHQIWDAMLRWSLEHGELLAILGAVASWWLAWLIGTRRGWGAAGLALGMLGPFGLLIVSALPPRVFCPLCRGPNDPAAIRCRHCGGPMPRRTRIRG